MSTINNDATFVADSMTRVAVHLKLVDKHGDTVLSRMVDSQNGHPKAACWDNGPKSDEPWCMVHERNVTDCHAADMVCFGVPLSGPSDPTGEAGIRSDTAAVDLKNLKKALHRMVNDASLIVNILAAYTPRPATEHERSRTADINDPHCESCSTIDIAKGVPWWVEPRTKERSTIDGRLPKAMWLCAWCTDHVRNTGTDESGILPSKEEVEQHRAGVRIRCAHPRRAKDEAA